MNDLFELKEFKLKESAKDVKIGQNLALKEREETEDFVNEFEHRFTPDPGTTDLIRHEVQLTSKQTIYSKPYQLQFHTNQELRKHIKEMLDLEIIRKS